MANGTAPDVLRELLTQVASASELEPGSRGDRLIRWGMFSGADPATIVNWLRTLLRPFDPAKVEIVSRDSAMGRAFVRRDSDGKRWRLSLRAAPGTPPDVTHVLCEPAADDHESKPWPEVQRTPPPSVVESTLPDTSRAWVADLLTRVREDEHVAGLAALVVRPEGRVHFHGLGFADLEMQTPITPDATFRIGSVSKTMTALAAMRLYEGSRFDLDDPVNEHLKAYRLTPAHLDWDDATIRHLLTHTSGIALRQTTNSFWWFDDTKPLPRLAEWYGPNLALDKQPGTQWLYNNHGFATLGQLVEDVSSSDFEAHMADSLFVEIGMRHTDYAPSDRVSGNRVTSYQFDSGELDPVEGVDVVLRPAGSVLASVSDVGTFLTTLAAGGSTEHGNLVHGDTLRLMLTPQSGSGDLARQGLGFFLNDVDGRPCAWHTGGWEAGQTAAVVFAPQERLGVAILANTLDVDKPTVRHLGAATEILRGLLE